MERGFPPVTGEFARVLIVGSMPSVASLEAQQYYANPRNAFWRIMGEILGFDAELPYEDRCAALIDRHIALWDVYAAAERPGSLDADIVQATAELNDFEGYLQSQWALRTVCCNGATAYRVFSRWVTPTLHRNLTIHKLPSTSPAYAAMRYEDKLQVWKDELADALAGSPSPG